MEIDSISPSPKRRKTSSHTLSSRRSSTGELAASPSPARRLSPNSRNRNLPLRRASRNEDQDELRDRRRRRYSSSVSRERSHSPDGLREDEERTYWRNRTPPSRRQRDRSRDDRDSSENTPQLTSHHTTLLIPVLHRLRIFIQRIAFLTLTSLISGL